MVRVKDTFVALDNIKTITYEERYIGIADCMEKYLVIKHFYDDELVRISVDSFQEFEELAQIITNAKWMKEKGE